MPIDDYLQLIRNTVLNVEAVRDLIDNRFYPSEIESNRDKMFPLATYDIESGELKSRLSKLSRITMRIWTFSKNDYDEGFKIYNAIFDALHIQRLSNDIILGCVPEEIGRPETLFDDSDEVYMVGALWQIRGVES